MKPRLSLIWATLWSLGSALVDRFRPLDQTQLITEDDRTFVDEIRALPAHEHIGGWAGGPGECGAECSCGVVFDGFDTHAEAMELLNDHLAANDPRTGPFAPPEPVVFLCSPVVLEPPLILDVLEQEWPAMWARREAALRMPTTEMRVVFDDMTALLAFDYVCTRCEKPGHHTDCPGCSCPCRSLVVTG